MQRAEFNLSDYWRIIRRRKFVIIAATVLVGGIVFWRNFTMSPVYSTSATVMVELARSLATGASDYYNPFEGDFRDTQTTIIASKPVAEEAAIYLGWVDETTPPDKKEAIVEEITGSVGAEKVRETNLIQISASSGSGKRAAMIASGVAHGYQSWSLKNRNEQARTVRVFVEGQLTEVGQKLAESEEVFKKFRESSEAAGQMSSLQSQLMNLELELASLLQEYTDQHPDVVETRAQIAQIKNKLGENPGLELEYSRLKRDVDTNTALYTQLKQRHQDARISEAERVSGVTVVDEASIPGSPVSPKIKTNTMVAVIVGLLLGLVLAFVKENLDTSIATIEDVEEFLGLPILGVIPQIESRDTKKKGLSLAGVKSLFAAFLPPPPQTGKRESRRLLVLLGGGTSPPVEAYKTLRTNIQFAVSQSKGKVLMFTSSGPGEGKTVTASNCAIAFAQGGQKVLLVSGDLRRGMVAEIFGLRVEPGLAEVISGDMDWKKASRTIEDLMVGELDTTHLLETPGIDNLTIMTSGRKPPNPAEFLQSERMKEFLGQVRKEFDYVLLDCPPVLPVSDALILAPNVDGVILVYQSGQTARGALKRAKAMVASSGVSILGVVLNAIKAQEMKLAPSYRYYGGYYGGKYGYGYGYGYGEDEKSKSSS